MRIRIGDRVRVKQTGSWGTVIRKMTRCVRNVPRCYLISLSGNVRMTCSTDEIEKLPRYRDYPQAWDTQTAMSHLQECM